MHGENPGKNKMSQGLFILFTPANGAKQRPSMRMTMARLAAFPRSVTLSGAFCTLLPSGRGPKKSSTALRNPAKG